MCPAWSVIYRAAGIGSHHSLSGWGVFDLASCRAPSQQLLEPTHDAHTYMSRTAIPAYVLCINEYLFPALARGAAAHIDWARHGVRGRACFYGRIFWSICAYALGAHSGAAYLKSLNKKHIVLAVELAHTTCNIRMHRSNITAQPVLAVVRHPRTQCTYIFNYQLDYCCVVTLSSCIQSELAGVVH